MISQLRQGIRGVTMGLAAFACAVLTLHEASAQGAWPQRDIELTHGFAPGGAPT